MQFIKRSLLICMISLLACQVSARDCSYLLVNGSSNWYPLVWRDDDGHAAGVLYDLLSEASKNIKIPIRIQDDIPWKRQLIDLNTGRLDIVAGMFKTPHRVNSYSFSSSLYFSNLRIFLTRENRHRVKQLDDLVALKGGAVRGLSLGKKLDDYAFNNLVIEDLSNSNSLFKMLASGRLDYGIFHELSGLNIVNSSYKDSIVSIDIGLSGQSVHMAYSKVSKCLGHIGKFRAEIERLIDTGVASQTVDSVIDLIGGKGEE